MIKFCPHCNAEYNANVNEIGERTLNYGVPYTYIIWKIPTLFYLEDILHMCKKGKKVSPKKYLNHVIVRRI